MLVEFDKLERVFIKEIDWFKVGRLAGVIIGSDEFYFILIAAENVRHNIFKKISFIIIIWTC